ncbi:MAG TPA: hypothetical protein PKL17_08045 [Pseudomonadota bacterium]|nr:hypothetical protein [Pseudomonadota bacterium]HNK44718.1 hypothetical protein [Pseudomonadota bacterium]
MVRSIRLSSSSQNAPRAFGNAVADSGFLFPTTSRAITTQNPVLLACMNGMWNVLPPD